MYICPVCGKGLEEENLIRQHFLSCWKEEHPFHKSKEAPHDEDVNIRQANDDVINFFEKWKKFQ